jgi:7-cyano-7-deazaguanine synthase
VKSVVLLSAGLDSTVNLAAAVRETEVVIAVTFDYGQKSALREVACAGEIAARYDVEHTVIGLDFLVDSGNALTGDLPVPLLAENDLSDREITIASANAVWVPNRNGVFVNVGAAIAEKKQAGLVVAGFNAEEAATFPDNSRDFVDACNLALSFSTNGRVKLKSYTLDAAKPDIIELGLTLNAPLGHVWSCYFGEESMCGECESCLRFKRAARTAGADFLIEGRFSK